MAFLFGLIIGVAIAWAIGRIWHNYRVKKEVLDVDFSVDKDESRIYKDELEFPHDFEDAFELEWFSEENSEQFSLAKYELGNLKVYEDDIRIGDIAWINRYDKLKYSFPIGNHPAEIAVAKGQFQEIAFMARIVFSRMEPVSWSNANIGNIEEKKIYAKGYQFYRARSGWFILGNMKQQYRYGGHFNADVFEEVFDPKHQYNRHGYLFESDGGNNLILNIPEGVNHISYYIGYDYNGDICRLLIDYNIYDWRNQLIID